MSNNNNVEETPGNGQNPGKKAAQEEKTVGANDNTIKSGPDETEVDGES